MLIYSTLYFCHHGVNTKITDLTLEGIGEIGDKRMSVITFMYSTCAHILATVNVAYHMNDFFLLTLLEGVVTVL